MNKSVLTSIEHGIGIDSADKPRDVGGEGEKAVSFTHLLSIAPMVDWTDTHFRVFMRMMLPKALLYTAMEPLGAVIRRKPRALYFDDIEPPLALQIGGSNQVELIEALQIVQAAGFQEFNLNLGCPSQKVLNGHFGACLMREGERVAEWVRALKAQAQIPVTIKMRTGVDDCDSYAFFETLAGQFIAAGVDKLIIHARKAWLNGISPKANRTLPPLEYEYVYRLKKVYPNLPIVINGQLNTWSLVQTALEHVDGVMMGRLACNHPYALTEFHQKLYPELPVPSRLELITQFGIYSEKQARAGVRVSALIKPMLNLCHGLAFAKKWKQALMEIQQSQIPDKFLALAQTYDTLERAARLRDLE